MLIDGFTVVAQIFNFLLLVWLLKRVLYGPIMQAMAKRDALIAQRLADAAEQKAQAEAEADRYRQLQEELADQRQDWLDQARVEVETHHHQWLQEAQQEVAIARQRWQQDLQQEQHQAWFTLQRQVANQLVATTRQVLTQLATADLEEQIVEVFIQRLHHLDAREIQHLKTALANDSNPQIMIRSSFDLSFQQRDRLSQVLTDLLQTPVSLEFSHHAPLLCGIELITEGYVLDWNLAHYLDGLEASLAQVFTGTRPQSNPTAPQPDVVHDGGTAR